MRGECVYCKLRFFVLS